MKEKTQGNELRRWLKIRKRRTQGQEKENRGERERKKEKVG